MSVNCVGLTPMPSLNRTIFLKSGLTKKRLEGYYCQKYYVRLGIGSYNIRQGWLKKKGAIGVIPVG